MNNVKDKIKNSKVTGGLYRVLSKIYNFRYKLMDYEKYAKSIYKRKTGKKLNLDNPTTYDEKLWWLKINYHNPLMTTVVDKYEVRKYVEQCGLSHILNELYGVYDKAEDVNFDSFENDKVFIKCNHRSGANIIYDKNKPFDHKKFIKKFNKYLNSNYYNVYREWPYEDVKPKLICEKILKSKKGEKLIDYRFMCFNGKVESVLVDVDVCDVDGSHAENSKINVYDKNFKLLDIKFNIPNFDPKRIKKPEEFKQMIEYAEILSKPFPHARVDLYNIDGKIYFGEITFFHRAGLNPAIEPAEYDRKLADLIDITKIKKTK